MEKLLLDACTLINLLATGEIDAIREASNHRYLVAEAVADEVFTLPVGDDLSDHEPISVRDQSGIEVVPRESVAETELFVSLSASLDTGEAETIAIAVSRGFPLATDDRAAQRLLQKTYPSVVTLCTSVLLRTWSEGKGADEVARALRAIETRASSLVPRNDPERQWWITSR